MENFMDKYYPGLKRRFAEQRIRNTEKLLNELKESYKKHYGKF